MVFSIKTFEMLTRGLVSHVVLDCFGHMLSQRDPFTFGPWHMGPMYMNVLIALYPVMFLKKMRTGFGFRVRLGLRYFYIKAPN